MLAARVRRRHQAWVVAGHAKRVALARDRFEQTVRAEIEDDELLCGSHVLGRRAHAVCERTDRAPEVLYAAEARIASGELRSPSVEPRCAQQFVEAAALDRCVADEHF